MFLSKKSLLKSCLLILCLGATQESNPVPPGAEGLIATAVALGTVGQIAFWYCTGVFLMRYRSASDITKNQYEIAQYTVSIKIYDKSPKTKKTFYTLKSNNPEEIIEKTIRYISTYSQKNNKVRLLPSVTLNKDKLFKMKTIESTTTKLDVIRKNLTKRFIVTDKKFTYKEKMLLGGVPALFTAPFTGGLGLIPLIIYYNV